MPPLELTFGDWNTDTQTSTNIDIQGDTFTLAEVIPDSTVSRPADDNSSSYTDQYGVAITSTVSWPSIGAQLSTNTGSDVSTAYLYRESDGTLLQSVDISSLSGGDAFTFEDVDLAADTTYTIVVDNNGGSYIGGYVNSWSPPYTSSDGDLTIIDGATGASQNSGINANNIVTVGNVGFN